MQTPSGDNVQVSWAKVTLMRYVIALKMLRDSEKVTNKKQSLHTSRGHYLLTGKTSCHDSTVLYIL